MEITWHGHSFIEIESAGGTTALVDPWMDGNPVTEARPADFDPDIVAITHGHSDHTGDIDSFDGVPVLGQPETTGYLAELGAEEAVAMNISGTYAEGDLSFTMTKAFHSSGAPLEGDYDYPMGTPVGFIIDDGETTFYDAGDTGLFGDMKTVIRDVFAPNVAAVPIGDRHTMDPELAGTAVDWVGADAAFPIHYDTFPFIEQDTREFADAVTDAEVIVPAVGDTIDY